MSQHSANKRNVALCLGLSIAFAVAERLLESSAMTLFVTHYPQVTSLAQMYPGAKNVHMRTSIDLAPDAQDATVAGVAVSAASGIRYLHEVSTGPCDMKSGYGLAMAEQCGFPREVLQDARTLRAVVRDKFPVLMQEQHGTAQRSLAAIHTLLQHLLVLRHTNLEPRNMQLYLHNLRERVPDAVAEEIHTWLLQDAAHDSERGDSADPQQAKSARL
jgi:DNA mismatch repair protein MSH4